MKEHFPMRNLIYFHIEQNRRRALRFKDGAPLGESGLKVWPVKENASEALNLSLPNTKPLAHTNNPVAVQAAFGISCWRPPARKHHLLQTRQSPWADNVGSLLIWVESLRDEQSRERGLEEALNLSLSYLTNPCIRTNLF